MPELKPLVFSELNPPLNVTLIQDSVGLEKLRLWAEKLPSGAAIGFDTETTVTQSFWFRRARTLQIGNRDAQFVIDLLAFAGSPEILESSQGNYGKNNGDLYTTVFEILDPIVCTNKVVKAGSNIGFDYELLKWNFGRSMWNMYSTDLAERVIQAGAISLKNYAAFSMAGLAARYFGTEISKELQGSFDLKSPLTQDQINYAAFDTRLPLAIRQAQLRTLTKDQLLTTVQIENDAIGAYVDMHMNGQRLDTERWLKRVDAVRLRRIEEIKQLDEYFIPIVGRKSEAINYTELDSLEKIWREGFEIATSEEMALALKIRETKDKATKYALQEDLKGMKKQRAAKKQEARHAYSEKSKEKTAKLKIIDKSEGEAFINYGSNEQLLATLKQIRGFSTLDSVADDRLLKFNDKPLIQILRRYRSGAKEIGTYGETWTRRWVTKPCKEEGWLHPGDGRLHCVFHQLEAETGRSSSSKPNAQNLPKDDEVRACFIARDPDEDSPEGYDIITIDLSGCELRIIAELAQAPSWINAFNKGQDVHSVSTEILYPERWPALAVKSVMFPEGYTVEHVKSNLELFLGFHENGTPALDEKGKQLMVPPCAYFALLPSGEAARHKCKCPAHNDLRNETKATNFLLAYGGGPDALADALGITTDAAKELMELHRKKFPDIWQFLDRSGEKAKEEKEARDLYGRRRLFPEPTWESAKEWYKEYEGDRLELSEEEKEKSIFAFKATNLREPKREELWSLTHTAPTNQQIKHAMRAMYGSIARRGKNHSVQGSNASILKRTVGTSYLWAQLPKYHTKLLSMVHDELVLESPKKFSKQVAELVASSFKQAAGEVMKSVVMESEYRISNRWQK